MSDPVYSVPAIAVPGLKIAYQIQIGEGQAIAYEAAVDSTLGRRDLDELLDRIGGAAERRKAMYDLPFHKARLAQNLELLPRLQRELAEAQAKAAAAQVQKRGERVREVPMTPQDMTAIGQIANRISETEKTIANDYLRIPYLGALIEGRPPPDLFPELKPEREYQPPRIMAAE
jgi:hypothetical protein